METYHAKCEQLKDLVNAELEKDSVLSNKKIYDFIAGVYGIDTKLVAKFFELTGDPDLNIGNDPEDAENLFKSIGKLSIISKIIDTNIKDIIDFHFFDHKIDKIPFKDLFMLEELKEIKELLKKQNRVEQELKGSKFMFKSMTSKFKKSPKKSPKKTKNSTKTSKKH